MKRLTLLLFVLSLLASCGSNATTENDATDEADSQMREAVDICFRNVIESALDIEELTLYDSAYVYMTLQQDGSVKGIFHDIPAEKDALRSHFVGILSDGVITANATVLSEGMEYEQEFIFKMVDNELEVETEGATIYSLKKVDCN